MRATQERAVQKLGEEMRTREASLLSKLGSELATNTAEALQRAVALLGELRYTRRFLEEVSAFEEMLADGG